jgi:tRNA threonylcarbamoyladenosine biosynthesis protein TsaB
MIDARRMEVFTALYDSGLEEVMPPVAMILDPNAFSANLQTANIVFCGNGMIKWKSICSHSNAVFVEAIHQPADLAEAAIAKFRNAAFADLAYAEPDYVKNVYTGRQ